MRMLFKVKLPPKEFNSRVIDGSVGRKIKQIIDEIKPEMVYFTEYCGHRGAIMIVDVAEPSDVPRIAEPWFLIFNAEVEFRVAMTPEELEKAGLDKLGKKWV